MKKNKYIYIYDKLNDIFTFLFSQKILIYNLQITGTHLFCLSEFDSMKFKKLKLDMMRLLCTMLFQGYKRH